MVLGSTSSDKEQNEWLAAKKAREAGEQEEAKPAGLPQAEAAAEEEAPEPLNSHMRRFEWAQ